MSPAARSSSTPAPASTGRDRFGSHVAAALAGLDVESAVIDGEIVVLGKDGVSTFSELQLALSEGNGERMIFYAFDLLWLDGEDIRARTADRPQGEAARSAARPRRAGAVASQRAFCRTRQGDAGACLPHGPRGRRLQAGRRALSQRPRPRLGEVEMHAAPGVRDRRLSAFASRGPRHPLAGAGLSQGRQAAAGRPCRHRLFRSRHGRSHTEASTR